MKKKYMTKVLIGVVIIFVWLIQCFFTTPILAEEVVAQGYNLRIPVSQVGVFTLIMSSPGLVYMLYIVGLFRS